MDMKTAERLAQLRRDHGYSQETLAAKLGLSRQAISKWERGESSPDTDNLIALADLYGMTLDELLNAPTAKATETPAQDDGQAASGEAEYCEAEVIDDGDEQRADGCGNRDRVHFGREGIHIESSDGATVHIGRGGIHVHENKPGGDHVDIDRHGIHVEEGKPGGDRVHVDSRGVHVNDEHFDSWREAGEYFGAGTTGNWIEKLPITLLLVFAFLCVGAFFGAWWTFWFFLLAIGFWTWVVDLVKDRRKHHCWMDNVPVFWICLLAFLGLGFFYGLWHPAWLVFLLIPIWGGFAHALHARRRQRERCARRDAVENG